MKKRENREMSKKQSSIKKSTLFKRPSIVLRRSEGDEIMVEDGGGKNTFDFSATSLKKIQMSEHRENIMDSLGSPPSPNNLHISSRFARRVATSGLSTSGSDSEEGTTDITDMTMSAEDMIEKKTKFAVTSTGISFLTPPPTMTDSTIPGVHQLASTSRWDNTYTDKDRAAAVVKGTKDIKVSLLMKRKEEIRRMMPEEKGARVFYGQGIFQHTRHGPGPSATKYFDTALSMQPQSSICYLARARCFLELGDAKRALEDANIVLISDPRSPKALGLIAECFYQLGDFEAALLHYHRAAAVRPDDEKYVLGVAKCKRAICNAVARRKCYRRCKGPKKQTSKSSKGSVGASLVSSTKSINDDVVYLSNLLKERAVIKERNNTSEKVVQIVEEALHYLDERRTFWHSEDPATILQPLPVKNLKFKKPRRNRLNKKTKSTH